MKEWRCVGCGHEVHANERPQPIKWTDGHTCSFVEYVDDCSSKPYYCDPNNLCYECGHIFKSDSEKRAVPGGEMCESRVCFVCYEKLVI